MKVNGCDRGTFEGHYTQAFKQWENRSKHEWQIDLGEYSGIIKPVSQLPSNAVRAVVAAKLKRAPHVRPMRRLKH